MAWVNKSRTLETKTAATKRNIQKATAKKRTTNDTDDANILAGVKVKHALEDLREGEEMILTLEDKKILDEQGRLNEDEDDADEDITLENALKRENTVRAKAFRESQKTAKPLWEEDGIKRSILDKYDEEEEEALRLEDVDGIEAAKRKVQNDIRAKLHASMDDKTAVGNTTTPGDVASGIGGCDSDYYTKEEMEAMRKPKKKKERHLKKKALTFEDLAELERNADIQASTEKDLGSRADRARRQADKAAELAAGVAEKRARFDAALQKANYASLALRSDGNDADGTGGYGAAGDEDDDLQKSLKRARELALKKKKDASDKKDSYLAPEALAEHLARRRAQQGQGDGSIGGGGTLGAGNGLMMSDIAEFTRNISVKAAAAAAAANTTGVSFEDVPTMTAPAVSSGLVKKDEEEEKGDNAMADIKEEEMEVKQEEEGTAVDVDGDDDTKTKRKIRTYKPDLDASRDATLNPKPWVSDDAPDAANSAVLGEKSIGQGLAGALAFLKDRGELHSAVEWAGRTNDSKNSYFTKSMSGYSDVFTGGRTDDRLALDIEVALTKKDEYGRVLTPKEAFRQLSQQFHGVKPSKNSIEKRAKQIAKELAQRKMATSGSEEVGAVAGLKFVQEKAATPYVVLEGTIKPGQSRNVSGGSFVGGFDDAGDSSSIRSKDEKGRGGGARGGGGTGNKSTRMFPPPPRKKQ